MHHLIESRLALIERLEEKCNNPSIIELEEIQCLFNEGLWIFSPDYESIEYLPQNLKKPTYKSTLKTYINIYSCQETRKTLVIVFQSGEINLDQRRNIEDHIDKLINQKIIPPDHIIEAYILGNTIKCHEIIIGDGEMKIHPLTYQELLKKAQKRLLNLSTE